MPGDSGVISSFLKRISQLNSVKNGVGRLVQESIRAGTSGMDSSKLDYLNEQVEYLLNEVSDLRIIARELVRGTRLADEAAEQTKESFSYQWGDYNTGVALLTDPQFRKQLSDYIVRYADRPADWFPGKTVLDAGCGSGRWAFGLVNLGADVLAVDQSLSGLAEVEQALQGQSRFRTRQADLLQPLPFDDTFDLVWCYGVAHHTGNTRGVVESVARAVKRGGRLFLMIYGEPRKQGEFAEINNYERMRRETRLMSFPEKIAYLEARYAPELVHGFFDAISPAINDLHRFEEIAGWLKRLGFTGMRRTLDNRNIHMVADLPA